MVSRRWQVVQAMLDLFETPTYLEVGVNKGVTFHQVKAPKKVAVDPGLRFDIPAKKAEQPGNVYREITSDAFFADHPAEETFDVVYLDGLHTFEQTLRDLINTLDVISPGGIVVVDDIWPTSGPASLPSRAEFVRERAAQGIAPGGGWMGDVYKLVLFVETFFQRWSFACVEDNHGQLVMWRQPRPTVPERLVKDTDLADYDAAVAARDAFRFMPLAEIVAAIRRERGLPDAAPAAPRERAPGKGRRKVAAAED